MTSPLKKSSEYPPPFESLTMLIYGDPGSGKTFFAGTFGNDVLYVNIGGGISAIHSPAFVRKHGKWDGFEFRVDPNHKDPPAVQLRDTIETVLDSHPEIHTIIIDDATALESIMMDFAVEYNFTTKKSETKLMKSKFDSYIPAIQDYGTQMSFIDDFMTTYTEACKNLQKNFIVLAHVRREYGEQKGTQPASVTDIKPSFIGKKNNIPAYFDMVWYAEVDGAAGQEKYRMRTQRTQLIEAKTRWGGIFPAQYENPSYGEIKSALEKFISTGEIPVVGSIKKPSK